MMGQETGGEEREGSAQVLAASRDDGSVGSVVFRFSLPAYGRSLVLRRAGFGSAAIRTSPLAYRRIPRPPLPGSDWARVRMRLMGICGSDTGMLKATLSPQLSPFASFPAVMGHEGFGVVVEAGAEVPFSVGQRVVGDPFLGCEVRGLEPCRPCRDGQPALCERTTEGRFAPAMLLGTCRDLPGTWSEETLYHRSQLHGVPDGVDDDRAALVEPLAVALHAVLTTPPRPGDRVLVIGDGPIGLLTVAALRLLRHSNPIAVLVRHGGRGSEAKTLGANEVVLEAGGMKEVAERLGGRVIRALDGRPVLIGGADVVYDAVGSREGLDLALRATRAGGRIALVGSPGKLSSLDVTGIWAKGVTVSGTLAYGREAEEGGRHTFDVAMSLLDGGAAPPIERLITHRFPLREFRSALATVAGRGLGRPGKVVFVGVGEGKA